MIHLDHRESHIFAEVMQNGSERMRILLVTEPSGGGSGRHVVDLASELVCSGHSVVVAYSPVRAEERFLEELKGIEGLHLEAVAMSRSISLADFGSAWRLKKILSDLGPFDILHAHSSKAGALLRLISPFRSVIYTPHAFRTMDPTIRRIGRIVYGTIEALLGRFLTRTVIAVAPEEAAHASRLGIPRGRVRTVVNGVAPYKAPERDKLRSELGFADDDAVFVFVGRLCDQKDPARFCHAIQLANSVDRSVRGLLIGDGELANTLDVFDRRVVVRVGAREARAMLPAADVFVSTSKYEAMPYVFLEALQAGLPLVATNVGGTSVAIRQGLNGFVLPVDAEPEEISEKILALRGREVRKAFSSESLRIADNYTAKRMAEETVKIYVEGLRGSTGSFA